MDLSGSLFDLTLSTATGEFWTAVDPLNQGIKGLDSTAAHRIKNILYSNQNISKHRIYIRISYKYPVNTLCPLWLQRFPQAHGSS